MTLHLCTKLLACDRKNDPNWPSKDDRFKGIYKSNYQFRRDWVAFLSHVVAYVELMYSRETDEVDLGLRRLAKIDKEPPETTWQKVKKWVPGLGAGVDDGDDVGEMLARLRELSV